MNWYWGDLHCHTHLGYGRGSVERAFEIARTHLDFCSVTGHAFWPDMPTDLQQYDADIAMHLAGFAKCRMHWGTYRELCAKYNTPDLVTFPSYEWHSSRYGDYVIYATDDDLALVGPDHPRQFDTLLAADRHMMIPHHIGYTENQRGIDWQAFRNNRFASVIEIYSNHGCAISDNADYDYYHAMGPRDGRKTADHGLSQGIRCGFIGSTDSHDGFPGHYSHGRVGVLAEAKTRQAIWQALRGRRTVAVTGAKIAVDFEINGAPLGSVVQAADQRRIRFALQGNQPFQYAQVIKNGRVLWHGGSESIDHKHDDEYLIKIEWGWGRKEQVAHWDCCLDVTNGELISVEPCFRHTAFDSSTHAPPHQIICITDRRIAWKSCTRGVPDSFVHNPQTMTSGVNALVMRVKGDDQTHLQWHSNHLETEATLDEIRSYSIAKHSGGPCSLAVKFMRAYPAGACAMTGEFMDSAESPEDVYYLTGRQVDGESIWSSPIWATREP